MDIRDIQSTIRAMTSSALAEALILGIDECKQNQMELTQVQQVHLAKMSIMSYDNALEACEILGLEDRLDRQFGRGDGSSV